MEVKAVPGCVKTYGWQYGCSTLASRIDASASYRDGSGAPVAGPVSGDRARLGEESEGRQDYPPCIGSSYVAGMSSFCWSSASSTYRTDCGD